MTRWGIEMYYDSGYTTYDSIPKQESEKISTAYHKLKRFFQKNGASHVGQEYFGKYVSFKVFLLDDGPSVILKTNNVPAKVPKHPQHVFRSPVSLEVCVSGGEEVHEVVKSVIEIAPFLEPDYREWTGNLQSWYDRFNAKYRK